MDKVDGWAGTGPLHILNKRPSTCALFVELPRCLSLMPANEEYSEQACKQWAIVDYGHLVNM